MEEFSKKNIHYILKVDENKQIMIIKALFSEFTEYLPSYIKLELNLLRNNYIYLLDQLIFTTTATNNNSSSNSNTDKLNELKYETPKKGVKSSINNTIDDELFGTDNDTTDIYEKYSDKILSSIDNIFVPIEQALYRGINMLGGAYIKQLIRNISNMMIIVMKHLLLKVDDLQVASGFHRDFSLILPEGGGLFSESIIDHINDSTSSSSSNTTTTTTATSNTAGSANNGTNKLKQQQSYADRLAQSLELSEVDSRVLITSALRTLQAVGRLTQKFTQLDKFTSNLLTELQQQLFNNSGSNNINNLLTIVNKTTNTTATSTNMSMTMGRIYTIYNLQQDLNSYSELKSFLTASTTSTCSTTSTSTSLQSPYSSVGHTLKKLRGAASQLLFKLCLEAPEKMISLYGQEEDVWRKQPTSVGSDSVEELREHMLPQSMITQVTSAYD